MSMGSHMLCTACGYQNQQGHRFCGMCGTPLPHRPLTAPGAHGTHTFLRAPLDSSGTSRERVGTPEDAGALGTSRGAGLVLEMPQVETPPNQEPIAPPAEMVPEVPLDEYIKSFRYVPPEDSEETTMRGDAHVQSPESQAVAETPAAPSDTAALEQVNSVSIADDVRERLGLEELPPGDVPPERPRFLDVTEPAPRAKAQEPAALVPVPSFLILGDKPVVPAQDDAVSTKSRDMMWNGLAVVALLCVVGLGIMEWRLQGQTRIGPIEATAIKLRNFWGDKSWVPPAPGSTPYNVAAPATQPDVQPKPQAEDQKAVAPGTNVPLDAVSSPPNNSTANGTQPSAAPKNASPSPAAIQPKTTPPQKAAGVSSEAAHGAQTPAAKSQPKAQAPPQGDLKTAARNAVPGAEELAKASNASDATAAAAWLWKATAKGNPDAPVRLADMYVKGEGVPRSCDQALVLLRVAATKENAPARNRLAAMYNSGTCVQRNRVEAYRWLSSALAADPNSDWALQNRDLIWQQMTPDERAAARPSR